MLEIPFQLAGLDVERDRGIAVEIGGRRQTNGVGGPWMSHVARIRHRIRHAPDGKVPFRIVHESTEKRYLTGADFDTEGFQFIGDTLWIGDEFGPFIIKADKSGRLQAVFETVADGKPVRSPDHYAVQSPAVPEGTYANVNLRRSKGFEGFASSPDGSSAAYSWRKAERLSV